MSSKNHVSSQNQDNKNDQIENINKKNNTSLKNNVTFGELFEIKNGLNKSKEFFGHGDKILNYMDVNENVLNNEKTIKGSVEISEEEYERYNVKYNDLFFTRTSETSEEIGLTSTYMGNPIKCVFSGFILRARPLLKHINSLYFAYYLRSPKMRNEIIKLSSITTRALISGKNLTKLKVNLPSLKEQNYISTFLLLIDKKIDLLEKTLCLYQKHVYSIKCNYFDNMHDFDNVKFKNLMKKGKAGGTPKSSEESYYDGDIPLLSIKDMTSQGKYIFRTEKTITNNGLENSSAWIIPKNSILYSIYASIGFVSINKIELATSQAIYGIILKNTVNKYYIYHYLDNFKRFIH